MSNPSILPDMISARKARLARFAAAAHRHANKNAVKIDDAQVVMLERDTPSVAPTLPVTRRDYTPRNGSQFPMPIIWRIKKAVADEFGITVSQLISKNRIAELCTPRYVAMGLMLDMTQMSLPAIGRQLGGRDHTTIINGRGRLNVLLKSEAFRNRYEQLKASLI